MSDQGERGERWTGQRDDTADHEETDDPTGPLPQADGAPARLTFPEVQVPEVEVPEPAGRTDFSAPDPAQPSDVRVAPQPPAEGGPAGGSPAVASSAGWEGSLFDAADAADAAGAAEEGDPRYAPVTPSGAGSPARRGTPSSGNWRMPEWIREEQNGERRDDDAARWADSGTRGSSRVALYGGVGLLVVALVAAGAVYFLKSGDDDGGPASRPANPAGDGAAAANEPGQQAAAPPDKALPRFAGRPTQVAGQVNDAFSGLSYPRFGAPWQLPTKRNKLGQAGWSGQQIVVTERRGTQLWYGQLLTGTLHPSLRAAYRGPDSVKNVAVQAARGIEASNYAFRHKSRPLASQALRLDGHQGWLVGSFLTYKRPGIRATGEIMLVGVIDTGREVPAVVHVNVPNTHRRLWPDINQFIGRLKVLAR